MCTKGEKSSFSCVHIAPLRNVGFVSVCLFVWFLLYVSTILQHMQPKLTVIQDSWVHEPGALFTQGLSPKQDSENLSCDEISSSYQFLK